MKPRRRLVVGATLALVLSGCGGSGDSPSNGPTEPSVDDPGFGHVHGLGFNAADGLVYAATHFGVFRLAPTGPERVADRFQDTMGFTIADADRFLGSGHPDLREDRPPHLGLVVSEDRAETWQSVSLEGEVDFHALSASGPTIYGWDSTSGMVMRSPDAGSTWERGAQLPVFDLDVDRADPMHVLAASEDGLLESTDGGQTFALEPTQPPSLLAYLAYPSVASKQYELAGVATGGTIWTRADGRWTERGPLPGAPEAFTAGSDGRLLGATSDGVYASSDDGDTWLLLASTTGQ